MKLSRSNKTSCKLRVAQLNGLRRTIKIFITFIKAVRERTCSYIASASSFFINNSIKTIRNIRCRFLEKLEKSNMIF